VESVSVVLTAALGKRDDLDVHVVTADAGAAAPERSAWAGCTIHRLPWRARRVLSGILGREGRQVARYIASLSADVVHAHDNYGIMLRDLDGPKVLTIHGFIHADTRVSGERFALPRSRLWRLVEHRAWARYPHIVSISPYVRERLSGTVTGVIHDIDNPIAASFFDIPRRDTGHTIFCAAVVSPRKNTLGLIDAFARVHATRPDAVLRLAGPPVAADYAGRVAARVRERGLEHAVTIMSSLTTAQVAEELGGASVVALLSLEENAPLTVQEAMAAAVPVVASNRCGMPYQIREGESGLLVDPHDTDGAADCIAHLLAHADIRASMGTRGRSIALSRFHPDVVAQRTADVYAWAAGRRFTNAAAPR
jgi:glycosyltransferase involved in cell wall biosynthesis